MDFVSKILRFAEGLAMNVLLITFMIVLIFQNQVFAAEEQKVGPVEATCEGRSSDYSQFNFGSVLVDDLSKVDRNRGFLAIDKNGRPAVYPLFERQNYCVGLSRHSVTDILAHWAPAMVEGDVYSFSFYYWANGIWKPARVDLQFQQNYCSRFRVVSDDAKIQGWLSAGAIPLEVDGSSSGGTFKLPLGLIEGPRDSPDCSIRPISAAYRKAVQEGKCPLGFSTERHLMIDSSP